MISQEALISNSSKLKDNRSQIKTVLIIQTGGTISMEKKPNQDVLDVRKGLVQDLMKKKKIFNDQEYRQENKDHLEKVLAKKTNTQQWYATPASSYGKRTLYQFYEVSSPVDSSNMTLPDILKIAEKIQSEYQNYDGFLVLSGTDTMCYSASMLSFILENLKKTIIFTGSMIPLSIENNDAENNLICSLFILGHFTIPEVTIFMNDRLIRGNRSKKFSSEGFRSFDSPMLPPLIQFKESKLGNYLPIEKNLTGIEESSQDLKVHKTLCDQITTIQFTPTLQLNIIKMLLDDPDTKGIILLSYGAGNVPSNQDELIRLLKKAVSEGKIIVNVSQCYCSSVSPVYQTGKVLEEIGVLFGFDLTFESCICKLAYVLGQEKLSLKEKKELMVQNLRGEMKQQVDQKKDKDQSEGLPEIEDFKKIQQILFPSKNS